MADADFLDLDDLDLLDDHQNVTENAEEYDFENFGFDQEDGDNEPPKSPDGPKSRKTETGSQEKVGTKPSQHSPVLPRLPKAENGLPENEELELELSMARKQKVRRKRRTREYGAGRHELDSDQSTDDYTPTSVLGAVRRFETKAPDPFGKSPPRVPPRRKPRVAGRLKGIEAKLDRVFSQEHRPDASEENTEEVPTVSPRNSTSSDVSVTQFKDLETNNNNNSNVVNMGRTKDKVSSSQTKLPSRTTEEGKHSALNGNSDMQLVARQHELIDIEEELLKEPSKLEIEKIFPPENSPKTTSGNQSSEDTLCSDDGKNRDTSPEGNQTATPTPTPKDCGSEAKHAGTVSKHKLLSERMWEVWRAGWDGNLADLQYHIGEKPFAMRDEGGDTILHTVVARGHLACIHWLAGGPCSDLVLAENEDGDTPTAVAAKYGQLECLQWLVCETPAARELRVMGDRQPLLHQAARYGQEACLRWLLSHMRSQNLGVDIQDHHGNSPAHIAGMHGHLTCLQTLVEYGVDVLTKNSDGLTPCMLAERRGHLTCVNYLIIVESCSTFSEQVIYLKQSLGNKLLPNRTAVDAHPPDEGGHEIRKMLTDYASFTRDLVQQFRQLQSPSSPQDLRIQSRAADLQTRFQQIQQSQRPKTTTGNTKMGLEPLDVMR
ncbi:synphilin-1-like [Branchiostoma lanceolatum]|uniref:synphilin-1-like n=1 Tax=Branchiostoma lanceolatum TaxID=7740 RepID=UPI003455A807